MEKTGGSYHKEVIMRLARATGHLESIKEMVADERDCSEILIQLSAVRAAVNAVSRIILQSHIKHCVVEAVERNDMKVIDDLTYAVEKILK